MVSIIIRTKNEEKWIKQCLERLSIQTYQDFEIVLVDNQSSDSTVAKAVKYRNDLIVKTIDIYTPGKSLNIGISASRGEIIAIISAHCLPYDEYWLEKLIQPFSESDEFAGVYGRQIPMPYSSDYDKRDLYITFGLDRKVQEKDTFFHNANSAIRKDVWMKYPFDEYATNIEDRIWAKEVISSGYKLLYEPNAIVYHHHGIHQTNSEERVISTVKVMKSIGAHDNLEEKALKPEELTSAAFISVRQNDLFSTNVLKKLLETKILCLKKAQFLSDIYIVCDTEEISDFTLELGVKTVKRSKDLIDANLRVDAMLHHIMLELEERGCFFDLIVPAEITYPFVPSGLIDGMIEKIINEGVDTVLPAYPEFRPIWHKENNGSYRRIDDFQISRDKRTPYHIGIPNLACVTHPEAIKNDSRIGGRVVLYESVDPIYALEMRSDKDCFAHYDVIKNVNDLLSKENKSNSVQNDGSI